MARAGWALREKWAMEAASAKLCSCGHRMGDHLELQDVLCVAGVPFDPSSPPADIDFSTVSWEKHPGHVVGEFHCSDADCDCIVRR